MKPLVTGDDMIEDVHVTISALLRTSSGLFMSVPEFIAGFVVFDRPNPTSFDDVENMWAFLDIPPLT